MTSEIHIGDVNTKFIVTVVDNEIPVNLSTATVKKIRFKNPVQFGGITYVQDMAFYTNGSDGILTYTVTLSDFTVAGLWSFQVYVEMPTGKWYSSAHGFKVTANL